MRGPVAPLQHSWHSNITCVACVKINSTVLGRVVALHGLPVGGTASAMRCLRLTIPLAPLTLSLPPPKELFLLYCYNEVQSFRLLQSPHCPFFVLLIGQENTPSGGIPTQQAEMPLLALTHQVVSSLLDDTHTYIHTHMYTCFHTRAHTYFLTHTNTTTNTNTATGRSTRVTHFSLECMWGCKEEREREISKP